MARADDGALTALRARPEEATRIGYLLGVLARIAAQMGVAPAQPLA